MRKTLALTLAALFAFATAGHALAATRLLETGSTLLYPLMNLWVADYQKEQRRRSDHDPGYRQRYRHLAGHRGRRADRRVGCVYGGRRDAEDARCSTSRSRSRRSRSTTTSRASTTSTSICPATFSPASTRARSRSGTTRRSRRSTRRAKLPHNQIISIHRAEGSGDTFLFTQYLDEVDALVGERPGVRHDHQLAVGLELRSARPVTRAWCRPARTRRTRSPTSASSFLERDRRKPASATPRSRTRRASSSFPTGAIHRRRRCRIGQAHAGRRPHLADLRAGRELVSDHQLRIRDRESEAARRRDGSGTEEVPLWAISPTGGQKSKYLGQVHFLPLPANIAAKSKALIGSIQ